MSHILLVEDDPLSIIVFKKILIKRGGFEVTQTEDAEEVLYICRNQDIALVIMDVSLSNSSYQGKFVDGLEITQLLKDDPLTQKIPVVLATAHAMRGDKDRFLEESGADGYISKPVTDHDSFIEIINNTLNEKVVS